MRISKIKLAGFKSFVDPTTLNLPHELTGVVGPNGCGKSNVIDAVLWVLGESSAKHLRGDAMSDVIFSGSNARKPVGQATVEIVFDNTDGKIAGEYAGYNEISIKRQLGRDGVSIYFLNGSRCRRKDITNLFLGTGIGPRSYSVIEQGMISRVIESKPEDLRVFLEEAAGISKYKERRRETENRIRHTKENLERLTDIRQELGKQLSRLERQAKAAERYKDLKAEERQVKAELTALSWKDLHEQENDHNKMISQGETSVEAAIADVRAIEAEIEKDNQSRVSANDQFNEIQGQFYGLGAEITGLEQAIQHATERRQNIESDSVRVKNTLAEIEDQNVNDQRQLEQTKNELIKIKSERAELIELEKSASQKLEESEKTTQDRQQEWDAFQQRYSEHVRNEQTETSKINHLQRTITSTDQWIERLNSERQGIVPEKLGLDLEGLETSLNESDALCTNLESKRVGLQEQIETAREKVKTASTKLDALRHESQSVNGRLASLEALQQSALGQDQRQVNDLLEQAGFSKHSKLAQEISVESGWELALEVVLAEHLDAICVDDLGQFGLQVNGLSEGVIGGIEQKASTAQIVGTSNTADRLLDKVSSNLPLETLIPAIYIADSVVEAMGFRSNLAAHESIVTKAGDRIGPSWLRLKRQQKEEAGVIEREREIRELQQKSATIEKEIQQSNETLEESRTQRSALETEITDQIQKLGELQRQRATFSSDLAAGQARFEQARSRITQIDQELSELQKISETENQDLELTKQKVSGLELVAKELKQQEELLSSQRQEHSDSVSSLREEWRKTRDTSHELALRSESLRSRKNALEESMQRHQMQLEQSTKRLEELSAELAKGQAPVIEIQQTLETALGKRLTVEGELSTARDTLQSIEQKLKQADQKRHQNEQALQVAREKLEQNRMEAQAVSVRLQGLVDQLKDVGFEPESLLKEMPQDAVNSVWQEKTESLERKITRLGPINLAAIDECQELSERKVFLDKQDEDLAEALDTLESAIRKIDKETRGRFKEIYDQVNEGFQTMFPRLFGGGKAHLELTGDDLLETGIAVIAQPPGKRNSSIHLLSGGEKALTAVSLVFAIFQLNPAPFCLLDEVDAPLDDANVVRLCDMLQEMSNQVQFIFITHNKITMEIAKQLVGVTMQEAGVSRLVSVDMDEAVDMVASG
ncbi:MAG: chromosome segregation protein SMC [Gammaproteobacteria bacterium]